MGNFIDEFRNSETAKKMADKLSGYKGPTVKIMEVCGTHTMSIFHSGIRSILQENIRLISGPGCPVCVTPSYYINAAIELSRQNDIIITTFGDMMRIPGKNSSLLKERAAGRDVRMVYSPLDSVEVAAANPDKKVVFLSVGFETTTPAAALAVTTAEEAGIKNFFILSANKTMPEVLEILASDKNTDITGFLYPGHVSAIIGTGCYEEIARKYKVPGVIAGFEPLDIFYGVLALITNLQEGKIIVDNRYTRVVQKDGNPLALEKLYQVFEKCDAAWRGIGNVPDSGLKLKPAYERFDAWRQFAITEKDTGEPAGCMCGDVLKGYKTPGECGLFGKTCLPENPVGACMVSSEGTCSAYYKYGGLQ